MPIVSFSGLASGIDGDGIIQATIDAARVAALPYENQITSAEQENTALDEFNGRLLTLRGFLDDFMTLNGGSVSKKGNTSNSDAVTITASGNAPTATSTVNVSQLARSSDFLLRRSFHKLRSANRSWLSLERRIFKSLSDKVPNNRTSPST